VRSAWIKLRRGKCFVGSYSDTPEITVIGPPPYAILPKDCTPEELGAVVRVALRESAAEQMSWDDAWRLADERVRDLAPLAGVKDRRTFERGTRLVDVHDEQGALRVTPYFRERGSWAPSPEALWMHVDAPIDELLGKAVKEALRRASA
jgi:hypothetical protein